MKRQTYPVPIRRLIDLVESKLVNHKNDIVITAEKEPSYIKTLMPYIDEDYEMIVFSKNELLEIRGWLNYMGKKLPIIMATKKKASDEFAMYCLFPEGEGRYYEYAKPRIVEGGAL